jgi:hypothetical protein
MQRLLIVALIMALPVSAHGSSFKTGNTLLTACNKPTDFQGCLGYIEGVSDAMDSNTINGFRACVPLGIEVSQAVDVVKSFLTKNAQKRQLGASGLVAQAFQEAWPCR